MKKLILSLILVAGPLLMYAQEPAQMPQFRRFRDWGGFARYEEANKAITSSPMVIFMGDSVTDFWAEYRPSFFSDHNYLGRGIGGQTVEHMVVRFQQDVVDLHPKVVVILAGINDIAQNNGPISLENIVACIKTMCEIAKANNIVPIVCSILPCDKFFWNKEAKPAQDVIALNKLLKAYTDKARITYADYHTPMGLPDGSLPLNYSEDGCHPTVEGYIKMEEIIQPVITETLNRLEARSVKRPTDWGNFGRYEEANSQITASPLLVLMGDSVTDYWYGSDPDFFNKNNFVCRGIAGQTASQMLVRFTQDVISLKPKAVAIMAGTNDLCQNMADMAYYPDKTIIDNIIAMCELAGKAGIKVFLCSITPCAHYMPIPTVDAGSRIVALNAALKAYASTNKNVTYVDYFTPLATSENGLDDSCSYDGIHPAINCYDDMERILVSAVKKTLKLKQDLYVLPSDKADSLKAKSDAERKEKHLPMNFGEVVTMMNRMNSMNR